VKREGVRCASSSPVRERERERERERKQKVRAFLIQSASQSVSMRDYYINNVELQYNLHVLVIEFHLPDRFWVLLRREQLPPNLDGRGNRFSMHQFRFLFNSARIPRSGMDEIKADFKTGKSV
jgi:hypothetical protein